MEEDSSLQKRNNDADSGLAAQQNAVVTQSPIQTNATVSGNSATQNITTNGTAEFHNDIEKKGEKLGGSKQNIRKKKKSDTAHTKYQKPYKKENLKDADYKKQKKSHKKSIKEKKKMKNRYRSNKNIDHVTCSKAKKYPTCLQIYRDCMLDNSHCSEENSKKKNVGSRQEKYTKEKSSTKDSKRLKTQSNNDNGKKATRKNRPIVGTRDKLLHKKHVKKERQNTEQIQSSGKIKKGKHISSDSFDSSKQRVKGANDSGSPIGKHAGNKKVLSKKSEKQKDLDEDEINRMLKYLRKLKTRLSDMKQNNEEGRHRETDRE
jgi:hypothetical protein